VTPLVLVHGSGLDGRCWDRVVAHLDGPSLAVDLPRRAALPDERASAIDAAAGTVVAAVDAAGIDELVLVVHSMAGCAVPAILERLGRRVRHVVFVAAAIPEDGATSMDILADDIRSRHPPEGGLALVEQLFANDMDREQLAHYLTLVNDDPPRMATEPVALGPLHAWAGSSTYVRTLRDQLFRLPYQDRFIANVGGPCRVVDLDAGHVCMVSRPEALAAVLSDAAAG
jgi:pimeloyl-ACP methyl ester carboxylesterase